MTLCDWELTSLARLLLRVSLCRAKTSFAFTKAELLRDVWGFRSLGTTRRYRIRAVRGRDRLTRVRRSADISSDSRFGMEPSVARVGRAGLL